MGARSAILYRVVRENFSCRVEVGGTEWGNQVREEEETQNTQSLVNHRLGFYYDWERKPFEKTSDMVWQTSSRSHCQLSVKDHVLSKGHCETF